MLHCEMKLKNHAFKKFSFMENSANRNVDLKLSPTKSEDQSILGVDDFHERKYNGLLSRVGLSAEFK